MDNRINHIYKLILELSKGNYDYRGKISDIKDEYDAIITGINMLAEELQFTTISRDYLKSIYDGIVDMVIVIDSNGLIEDYNSAAHLKLGYNDLIGKSFNTIFPSSQPISFSNLVSNLKIKNILTNVENTITIKNNITIPCSCSFSMIKEVNKKEFKILMLIKDVSHLKNIEQMLVKRNQDLNTFIYRASHDLKGPLASMMGLMNLIEESKSDLESTYSYLELIKESTIKLNKVVSDLLDLGRITLPKNLNEEVYVNDILESILNDMRFLPDRDRLSVTIDNNQTQPLKTEPIIIKSILQNLVENSLKYRKPETTCNLNIRISNSPSEVEIVLQDDGMGIDDQAQKKVFDMFYRGSNSSNGSGLGLYIVKTGIDKLNGRIELFSELFVGSKFIITLPN